MTDSSQDPERRPPGPDAPAPPDPASGEPPAPQQAPQEPAAQQAPQEPAPQPPFGSSPPYAPPAATEPTGAPPAYGTPPPAPGTPAPYGSPPTYGTPTYGSPAPSGTPGGYGPPPGAYPPAPGGYGAQPPPGYPQPARAPGTDGFAIAGFVLSLIGGILLSVIFAILALNRIRRSGQGGKGLAIAALVISAGWLLIFAALVVVAIASGPQRSETGAVTEPGRVRPVELKVGDCTKSEPAEGEVGGIDVVPCTTPHAAEVYAVFDLPDGSFPGIPAVEMAAEKGCSDRLPAALENSDVGELGVFYLYPQQANWRLGDHSVTCLVVSEGAPLTAPLLP